MLLGPSGAIAREGEEDSPLSDERVVGDGYAEAGAAFPHEGIVGIEATARETRDDRLDGCDSRSCRGVERDATS